VQTGVLGVTSLSPSLSIARSTGRMVFSVFDRQGNDIVRLDGDATRGTPIGTAVAVAGGEPDTSRAAQPAAPTTASPSGATNTTGTTQPQPAALGGRLPPFTPRYTSAVEGYLADATTGLAMTTSEYAVHPYSSALHLDYIAPPTLGVQTGGFYGTQFGGGVAFGFSDQLGNNNLVTILQAQGDIQDIGGEAVYTNLKHRWNYAALVGRIPYLTAYQFQDFDQQTGAYTVNQVLYRIYLDQVGGILQYPLSTTRRIEMGLTGTHQSYRVDVYRYFLNGAGQVIGQDRFKPENLPPSTSYTQGTLAFVGDYSTFGFTSPIAGGRYRFDVEPTVGQLQMTSAIADYRRYLFARPVTFAARVLHYGRYGRDAEDTLRLYPIYLGNPQFVRGYDYNSINPNECGTSQTSNACPIFDRLLGSRIAVASAEVRIPLLGVEGLGLIRTNFVPVEIAPFVDAGIAWNSGDSPKFGTFATGAEARNSTARIPVVSAGISARINLFGYAVLETYYAKPFQRPDHKPLFGFQLAPGW
jgi:hypothetical protein